METLKYSLLVVLGAAFYGTLSTIVKMGYHNGFTAGELIGSQYFIGWLFITVLFLFSFNYKISWKNAGLLLITGVMTALVGITYAISVAELPASIAVVFLFQFTWMGVLLESLLTKMRPSRDKLIAIAFLLVGTLLAGGIFGQPLSALSMKGVLFGLLAALFFSLYMICNSKAAIQEAAPKRLFFIGTGAMLTVMMTTSPVHVVTQLVETSLWKPGILLGLLGVVIPFFLFAISMPKIGAGLGTILCAAELPAAIIVSIIFLSERVTALQWLGMLFIVVGITVPELLKRIPVPVLRLLLPAKWKIHKKDTAF